MLRANAVDYMMKTYRICYLNAQPSFTKDNLYTKKKKNEVIGVQHWRELFNNRDRFVKRILDCSRCYIIKEKPEYCEILHTSTDLIYRLYVARINKLSRE